MARELGVDDSDYSAIQAFVEQMVEPLNIATEAIWRALMNDSPEDMEKVLERFKDSLKAIRDEVQILSEPDAPREG
jgi:hypothetical protein